MLFNGQNTCVKEQSLFVSISQTPGRDFTLRVSAIEIYNEMVIDLLNRESGPLRLLDDPEVQFNKKNSYEIDKYIVCISFTDVSFSFFVVVFLYAERDRCGKTN